MFNYRVSSHLSACTENILLEAVHLKLGAVWCAVYPDKRRIDKISKALSLDKHITPFAAIYVGYEDGNIEPKDKFDHSRIHII